MKWAAALVAKSYGENPEREIDEEYPAIREYMRERPEERKEMCRDSFLMLCREVQHMQDQEKRSAPIQACTVAKEHRKVDKRRRKD